MIDGFSGQHCNFDLIMENKDSTDCIITSANPKTVAYEGKFSAYPNPTMDFLNFEYLQAPQGKTLLSVFDVAGRELIQKQLIINTENWDFSLDVSNLPQGLYIYSLITDNQQQVGKFQKINN